jgi:methylase of polypeptide subunit release factors
MPLLIGAAGFVLLAFSSVVIWTWKTHISPTPSTGKAVQTVITALESITAAGNRRPAILEAGSGWGTLLFAAARAFPDSYVTGYELSPLPFAVSLLFAKLAGRENVTLRRRDFLTADLRGVDIIVTYLHPEGMEKLRQKIEAETAGTIFVVSNNFQFRGWTPIRTYPIYDAYHSKVYVYKLIFG